MEIKLKVLYEMGKSFLPSTTQSVTMGTGALAGLYVGGPVGALVGGAVAYVAGTATGNAIYSTGNYIRNGSGTVYYRAKELVSCIYTVSRQVIHCMTASLPACIVGKVETTKWVKAANLSADEAYLAKCRKTRSDGKSMNLDSLFIARPGGVSSQEAVINALAAQAIADDQGVTKEKISQWVALGDRLIHALSSGEASKARDGAVVVKSPEGEEIYVESSVYSTRAIMWYFMAQAVWGELARQNVLLSGHAEPTDADIQKMVRDARAHEKFVFPDKHGQIFTFLNKAKTQYIDTANLLCHDSALRGADQAVREQRQTMALPSIDDTSRYLPGGARRTSFNLLMPRGNDQQLAVRLEDFSNPTLLGQRSEGHEPVEWHAAQVVRGASDNVLATVQNLATPSPITPKTRLQVLEHKIHKKLLEALQTVKEGDATWAANREQAFTAAKQLPLHALLPYLIHDEYAKVHNGTLAILNDLSAIQKDELKVMIYRALLESVQAGEMHRHGHENLLMPYMTEKEVRDYWRTQVADVEDKLFQTSFTTIESDAHLQEREESWVSWAARLAARRPSFTVTVQERKAHEQALFQKAYLSILTDAQTPSTIEEFDFEDTAHKIALKKEIGEFEFVDASAYEADVEKAVDEFEFVDAQSVDTAASITPELAMATMMKPEQRKGDLSSFMVKDYIGAIPSAPLSASISAA
jgi:hypothetical protein